MLPHTLKNESGYYRKIAAFLLRTVFAFTVAVKGNIDIMFRIYYFALNLRRKSKTFPNQLYWESFFNTP